MWEHWSHVDMKTAIPGCNEGPGLPTLLIYLAVLWSALIQPQSILQVPYSVLWAMRDALLRIILDKIPPAVGSHSVFSWNHRQSQVLKSEVTVCFCVLNRHKQDRGAWCSFSLWGVKESGLSRHSRLSRHKTQEEAGVWVGRLQYCMWLNPKFFISTFPCFWPIHTICWGV